jgi:peptidyl-prolyl cis-trans isomerase B (cyclophilin B)
MKPRQAAPLLLAGAALLAGCGSSDSEDKTTTTTAQTQAEEPAAPQGCRNVEAPEPRKSGTGKAPTTKLSTSSPPSLTFETNCGSFTIKLDPKASPKAAASMDSLARKGFYDGTVFHRIVPGFVIQGGDPTGTGTGDAGYSTVDKPAADTKYTRGVVAMAKGGDEPPGAASSQFFVVTGADVGLPPDYAVSGHVTKGQDVVDRIGALGNAQEQPTFTVVVQRVRVAK